MTMEKLHDQAHQWPVPPKQQPYLQALELAFDAMRTNTPSHNKLESLGAQLDLGAIRLPVLNHEVIVDVDNNEVKVAGGNRLRVAWALLVLHYLGAEDITTNQQEVSLAHFPDNRGYFTVFEKRIINRFLKTVGKTSENFAKASSNNQGTLIPSTGLGYRFDVLPRIPISIIRYDGDEDFGPGANVIYRADVEYLLPAEDRIVAVELLLNTLSGASIEEDKEGKQ